MIFYKASSFGNDFIAIDLETLPTPHDGGKGDLAREICNRQVGVGADGVVYYRVKKGQAHFQIYNRNGGAAELSGNGMAGLAAVLQQRRLARSPMVLRAGIGPRRVLLLERHGPVFDLDVEIGVPDFVARAFFPFLQKGKGSYRAAGVEFHPVSVGNPHAVVVCRELPDIRRLESLGKKLESNPIFPKRTNVEFVEPTAPGCCRVYYYERGVGPTQASSTGSAAVFAVLRRLELARDRLLIEREAPAGREVGGQGAEYLAGIRVHWQNGIHIRIVTRLVCRGEYFLSLGPDNPSGLSRR